MNHRLSAQRFLALGALAQAPNMTMNDTQFLAYIASEVHNDKAKTMLYGLVRDRLVSHNHMRGTVTLTDLGGDQLRVIGSPKCPPFLRVPDEYLE